MRGFEQVGPRFGETKRIFLATLGPKFKKLKRGLTEFNSIRKNNYSRNILRANNSKVVENYSKTKRDGRSPSKEVFRWRSVQLRYYFQKLAQQSSARKAGFLNLSISMN